MIPTHTDAAFGAAMVAGIDRDFLLEEAIESVFVLRKPLIFHQRNTILISIFTKVQITQLIRYVSQMDEEKEGIRVEKMGEPFRLGLLVVEYSLRRIFSKSFNSFLMMFKGCCL